MANKKEQPKIFLHISEVDVSENDILEYSPDVLDKLLIDHTMSAKVRAEANDMTKTANIFWATDNYEELGEGYAYRDEITPAAITGNEKGRIIMPRVLKDKQTQIDRTKDKAEVFTPSWVCNAQNNLIDDAWFGPDHKNAFNEESIEDGQHVWTPTERVIFPEGDKQKTWQKYVTDNRMEITCGEAPYLVSRYDTTTGEPIPIMKRIGLLDRKLRVINENVETEEEWYKMAEKAFKHTYGYEWQGDNLLLAREALLYTYIEYFIHRFNEKDAEGKVIPKLDDEGNPYIEHVPKDNKVLNIARIISWNIWQMDGIKMVVPDSCHDVVRKVEAVQLTMNFFDKPDKPTQVPEPTVTPCPGCASGEVHKHNGEYCLIRDWNKSKPKNWQLKPGEDPKSSPWQKIKFISLLNSNYTEEEEEPEDEE